MGKHMKRRVPLMILFGTLGAFALAGCSAQPSTEVNDSASEPAPVEQKGEPVETMEPEVKTETFEFPHDWVVDYEDLMNPETRYDVPTTYFEELGITDYEVSDENVCTVEAPEGTWDKLKARVSDFMEERVLANNVESGSVLSCEIDDEFSSISITLDAVLGGAESMMLPGNAALFAVNQGAVFRTFAGLDPVFHGTVIDRNGDVIIDRDYDASKQQELIEDIRATFGF